MSLGFALVHPQRLQAALDESFTEKVGWDDGADVILAGAGVDIGDDPFGAFLAQLRAEALELLGELQSLVLPGGPWTALGDALRGETDGVAGWIRRVGAFLVDLDPLHLKATVGAQLDALFLHFPGFDLSTLDDRLRRLAQQALSVLRAPLLGGRDDGAAHRAYRVAAMLLARLEPLLRQLDAGLAPFDLKAALGAWLRAAIDKLPTALLTGLADLGRILQTDLAGFVEAALSLSVSVSVGPQTLVTGTPGWADDADPQPFAKGSALWVVDLVTSGVALFWSIWGFQRSRGIRRPTEWIEFFLATGWHLFRDSIRLFVQPTWLSKESSGFVRMLFSEWGDLFVRLILMLIGSIEDMVAWSNFVMGFGNRFLKWFLLELQPRLVYLFARSVWYLRSWHDDTTAGKGSPKFVRVLWAGWAPALVLVALMGLLQSGESYDLQAFFQSGHEGASASLILVLVFQLAASIFVPWLLMGEHPFRRYSYERFDFIALAVATFMMAFIGVETLASTNVGADAGTGLRIGLYILFGIPLICIPIGQAASGPPGNEGAPWYEVMGAVEGWLIAVLGAAGIGIVTFMTWWFVRRDGEDADGDFEGMDAATSPYLLPYPKGEMWFCGQGFHGVFSHTWRSARPPYWKPDDDTPDPNDGSFAADNLFAYDFNEAYGEPACAARAGFVRKVTITNEDGGADANSVELQHWDWVAGHDPGSDLERELTYATYHHLAKQKARCITGHFAQQGYNLAAIDDTGVSALNHLHFQISADVAVRQEQPPGSGTFALNNREYSLPTLFRDSDARGFRSFGHIDGKPISLAYYTSENVGGPEDEVTLEPVTQPIAATAQALETDGHTHTLYIGADRLGAGALPDSLVAWTTVDAGHCHEVRLTAAQLRTLLKRGAVSTEPALGPTGNLTAAALPALSAHVHPLLPTDNGLNGASVTLTSPPGGHLLTEDPGPYDLSGEQLAVDSDGVATAFWLWGAHRPAMVGALALDRGPTGAATVTFDGDDHSAPAPSASAQLAAKAWTDACAGQVTMRLEPVIVLESRARGQGALIRVASSPALTAWGLPEAAIERRGTGAVADLAGVTAAALKPLVEAALGAGPGAPAITTNLPSGGTLQITATGAPIADFSSSHPRLREVLTAAYSGDRLRSDGDLPLVAGRLVLDTFPVPLLAAPARLRLPAAASRLDLTTLRAEPLVLRVSGADQTVRFRPDDLVAGDLNATLDRAAARVAIEADGVRAWRDGSTLVIETVAGGAAVTLRATKGSAVSPTASGGAPPVDGVAVNDTTALPAATLGAAIRDAVARAGRAAAVGATVSTTGEALTVTFPAGVVPTLGGSGGWAATTIGDVLTLVLPTTLEDPLWADVSVGGGTWRIAIDADTARLDLGPLTRPIGAAESLEITTASGTTAVTLPAGASLDAQVRALSAVPGLTARVAWRWRLEGEQWIGGDLKLTPGAPSALPTLGFVGAPSADAPGAGPAAEPVRALSAGLGAPTMVAGLTGPSPTTGQPAFAAAAAGDVVTVTPHAGFTLSIELAGPGTSDPTGLTGDGPTRASAAMTPGRVPTTTVRWRIKLKEGDRVRASGYAQLAGAPPMARADAAPGWTWNDSSASPATPRPQPLPLAAGDRLEITVTAPDDSTTAMSVDLDGAADLDEVVARVRREAPLVDAWRTRTANVLHLQARGAGTGWRLRLGPGRVLGALGFNPARLGADGALVVAGRGDVRDMAAATATELAAALERAAPAMAWAVDETWTVNVGASAIELRSAGALTLDVQPASLLAALSPAVVAGGVDIPFSASSKLALDQGVIRVLLDGQLRQLVQVVGSHAAALAAAPLPVDDTGVAALVGLDGRVDVNGANGTFTVPASAATVDDVLHELARVSRAHVRRVTLADGDHLELSSRRRGASSRVEVHAGPVLTALGFVFAGPTLDTQVAGQDPGVGTFDDLNSVDAATLADLLKPARLTTAQTLVTAAPTSTGVSVTPAVGRVEWINRPAPITGPALDPGGLVLLVSDGPTPGFLGQRLSFTTGATTALVTQRLQLRVSDNYPATGAGVVDRTVLAALWANPARLGPWVLPANLTVLDGRTLHLKVDGANVDVPITGLSAVAIGQRAVRLASLLTLGTRGRVRVSLSFGFLRLETADEGADVRLELVAGAADDASTLFNPPPGPQSAIGTGSVARRSAVTRNELAGLIQAGVLINSEAARDPAFTDQNVGRGVHVRLASGHRGAVSAVLPVVLPADLKLRRALQRGPARGGAVILPPLSGPVTLSGSMFVVFNEGNTGARAVPSFTAEITLPAATYSPQQLHRRIQAELDRLGVGVAGLYPERPETEGAPARWRIAIESRVPGLQGTARFPGPGTSQAVLDAFPTGSDGLFGRGWPGVGFTDSTTTALTLGLRTRADLSGIVVGRTWRFTPGGGGAPVPVVLAAGDTSAAAFAARLDTALAGPGIAIARVHEVDRCVYLELIDPATMLTIFDGAPPAAVAPGPFGQDSLPPPRVGAQRDMWVDEGAQARLTATPRTCRLAALLPDGSAAGRRVLDPGWLRLRTDFTGMPGNTPGLAAISYGVLARADAAKSDDYRASGDMLVSTGAADLGDGELPIVHQARYWVVIDGADGLGPLRVGAAPDEVVLLQIERT